MVSKMIEIFRQITSAELKKLKKIIFDFYENTPYHTDILESVDLLDYKKEHMLYIGRI